MALAKALTSPAQPCPAKPSPAEGAKQPWAYPAACATRAKRGEPSTVTRSEQAAAAAPAAPVPQPVPRDAVLPYYRHTHRTCTSVPLPSTPTVGDCSDESVEICVPSYVTTYAPRTNRATTSSDKPLFSTARHRHRRPSLSAAHCRCRAAAGRTAARVQSRALHARPAWPMAGGGAVASYTMGRSAQPMGTHSPTAGRMPPE